jgi:septin family protein
LAAFVESKFEETFAQESRVVRTPGIKDTHIHCVFLLLDPVRLDKTMQSAGHASQDQQSSFLHLDVPDETLDLDIIRALKSNTTVIPIIAKADTLTAAHMAHLKRMVWFNVKYAKLDPLEALNLDDEDEDDESPDSEYSLSELSNSASDLEHGTASPPRKVSENTGADGKKSMSNFISPPKRSSSPAAASSSKRSDSCTTAPEELFLPFSILSSDSHALPGSLTRVFPWGEADPCNPDHCDYSRLYECVFGDWRSDLRLASREKWYEDWRTRRLKRTPTPRVRQFGGVTPIGVVPKEGRTVSPTLIANRSRAVSTSKQASRMYDDMPERPRTMSTSKAERVLGSPRGIAM